MNFTVGFYILQIGIPRTKNNLEDTQNQYKSRKIMENTKVFKVKHEKLMNNKWFFGYES